MKKRIIALLLVLATMLSLMGSAAPTMIGESAVSESMIEEVAAAPAADEPVCSVCGNADCTCDKSPWELVGEMQSAALIGVFDRSKTSYTCYKAGDKQPVTIDASVCPAYVIIAGVYNHAKTGKPMVYRADSLDDGFYFDTLAPNPYIDASDFTKVMSAEGMYATVNDALGSVTVHRDLGTLTDAKSISTADLNGEYVVADFCFEDTTYHTWMVKLVPDEAWPEGKEEYVWMLASNLASLSLTPTRYDASENMDKLAVLSQFTKVYGLSVSGNHAEYDSLLFYADDFAADTVLRITDWYWDEETTGLWYQVALENGAFPESTEEYTWPNPAWILQGYTDEIAAGNAALAFVDPELIAIRNELLNQGCLEEFEAVLNGLSADVLARLQASALWYIIEIAYHHHVYSHFYSLGTEEEYNAHAAKYPEAWAYIQADEELKQYADMHLERIRYVAENPPEDTVTYGEIVYVTLPSYTNVAPLWGGGVSAGQPYSAEYLSRSGRSSSGSGANTGDNVDNPIDKPSNDSTEGNGVYLGKSLKYENGQYTIRLESYTTGSSVTTVTKKEMPADIILVLDLSSSMVNNSMQQTAYRAVSGTAKNVYNSNGDNLYVEIDGEYKEVTITPSNPTVTEDYVTYEKRGNNYRASELNTYINNSRNPRLYFKEEDGNYYEVKVRAGRWNGTYTFYYDLPGGGTKDIVPNIGEKTDVSGTVYRFYRIEETTTYTSYTFSYTGANGQGVSIEYGANDEITGGTNPTYYEAYNNGSITRAQALKNAVTNFSNQVAEKAKGPDGVLGTEDDVAHCVGIVGYSGNTQANTGVYIGSTIDTYSDGVQASTYASALQDMSTNPGVSNVNASIAELKNNTGTHTYAGTEMANGILAAYNDPSRYVQDGKAIRSKVVVVFTDGKPYGGLNDTDKYNVPIQNAYTMKNTYGATVYSVGVLDGGNVAIPPTNNLNKLMHYMSSNYQNATSLNNSGTLSSPDGGYYLLASNADDLNNIFSAISESVNSSQSVVQLNEKTEVRDVISPYFKLPDGVQTSAIKVYTSQYLGGDNWEAAQEFPLVGEKPIVFEKVDYKDENGNIVRDEAGNPIQTDALKVTGFDFAEHWVGPVVNNGETTYHGDKLIIEFPVEVNPDFLGGSNVITNGAESGIYGEKGSEGSITKEEVDIYNQPSANEKVKPIKAPVRDRHVYSGSTINLTDILDLHIVEGNSDKDLQEVANGVNNAYTEITYTITFENGEIVKYVIPAGSPWNGGQWLKNSGEEFLGSVLVNSDRIFTVNCVMVDINDRSNKSEVTSTAYIYAWTPVITFKDTLKAINADTVDYDSENRAVEVSWEHPKVKIYVAPGDMLGTENLTYEYTTPDGCLDGSTVISRTDFYVNVNVKNNGLNIDGIVFRHADCPTASCDVDDCSFDAANGEFIVHVQTGHLAISKTVEVVEEDTNAPEVEDFVVTIKGPENFNGYFVYYIEPIISSLDTVVRENRVQAVNGTATVSLKDGQRIRFEYLPVGEYTVTETDYSSFGYDSNVKVDNGAYAEGNVGVVTLTRGETNTVDFLNKFPVADLDITKTVTKEFAGDAWTGDTFVFTVERNTLLDTNVAKELKNGNRYTYLLDGVQQKVKVDGVETDAVYVVGGNKLTVYITFTKEEAATLNAAGESVTHTITLKNLPVGYYTVTETADAEYNQTPVGLAVSNIKLPADDANVNATAEFTNELKRLYGDLEIYKTVEIEDDVVMEEGHRKDYFWFYVVLDGDRNFKENVEVRYGNAAGGRPTTLVYDETVGGYAVQVADKEIVRLIGLPAVDYQVSEEDLAEFNYLTYMDNDDGIITPKGTDRNAVVEGYSPQKVTCTNHYPARYGNLEIIKTVAKAYDADVLPGDTFTFTVEPLDSVILIGPYTVKIGDATTTVAVTDQKLIVEIPFNVDELGTKKLVIEGLPRGQYKVIEAEDVDYEQSARELITEVEDSGVVSYTNTYKKHLGDLTIHKIVNGTTDKDTFVFHISGGGVDMDVTINGSGSVTIKDLPLGTYTVTESSNWSWRYSQSKSSNEPIVLSLDNLTEEVTFTNTYSNNKWLSFETSAKNIFGSDGVIDIRKTDKQ